MISFIVPAYNEERLLPATLLALHVAARAIGERYEVIVADDASTDRTAAVARSHDARVVQVARRQIAATRNAGAREANGDLLIFVDADTVVSEAVLRAAIRAVELGAVGGGATVRFDGPVPVYARVLLVVTIGLFRAARLAAGCFLFCTRRAFDAVGGFDEAFFGAEEIVMSNALKRHGRFVVLREAVVTSGRKVRAYSGVEALWALGGFILHGPRSRRGLAIWYEKRREDPRAAAIIAPGGDGMRIRLSRDLEGKARGAPGAMTVEEFFARFPEVPRDLGGEPVLAEFVHAFGAQLRVAQKPSPCVARADAGDAEHHFYTRLVNDLAIYGIGLARRERTLQRLEALVAQYRTQPATFACTLVPRKGSDAPAAECRQG